MNDDRPPWYTGDRFLEALHELEFDCDWIVECFRSGWPVGEKKWEDVRWRAEYLHRTAVESFPSLSLIPLATLALINAAKPPEPSVAYDAFVRARPAFDALLNAHLEAETSANLSQVEETPVETAPADSGWNIIVTLPDHYRSDDSIPRTIGDLKEAGFRRMSAQELATLADIGTCDLDEMVERALKSGAMKGWRWRLLGPDDRRKRKMLWIDPTSIPAPADPVVDSTTAVCGKTAPVVENPGAIVEKIGA